MGSKRPTPPSDGTRYPTPEELAGQATSPPPPPLTGSPIRQPWMKTKPMPSVRDLADDPTVISPRSLYNTDDPYPTASASDSARAKAASIIAAVDGEYGPDQKAIAEVGLRIVETLLRKNRDYGSSVFHPPVLSPEMPPRTALLVRMSDKIARLKTLLGGADPNVQNESSTDTMTDLAGYSILWIAGQSNPEFHGPRQ